MAAKGQSENLVLQVEDVRVDADPAKVSSMLSALIHIPSYRKSFEADPVAHLRECGIHVSAAKAKEITRETIRATINELTEGAETDQPAAAAAVPGVAVGVRVGTRPGTRPGVNVGVRVVTGSRTFGSVAMIEEDDTEGRKGLGQRQKGQRKKKEDRA